MQPFTKQPHRRLFNDNDDKVTQTIMDQIHNQLIERTQEQKQVYNYDFFAEEIVPNRNFVWKKISNQFPFEINSKEQESSQNNANINQVQYMNMIPSIRENSQEISSDFEEYMEIEQEPSINQLQESNSQLDQNILQPQQSESPCNRNTIQLYPEFYVYQKEVNKSQQNGFSIQSSINMDSLSTSCSIAQSLRLSCANYLDTKSTVAEEEDFSPNEQLLIKKLSEKRKQIFEQDEDLQDPHNSTFVPRKKVFKEENKMKELLKSMVIN